MVWAAGALRVARGADVARGRAVEDFEDFDDVAPRGFTPAETGRAPAAESTETCARSTLTCSRRASTCSTWAFTASSVSGASVAAAAGVDDAVVPLGGG